MERKPNRMSEIDTILKNISIHDLISTAQKAGEAIMSIYHQPFDVYTKEDGSPLTLADQAANKIINDYLQSASSFPILSEENESVPYSIRQQWQTLWVVDPLDGTKEFINKRREFTVNIALVYQGKPILGIIYAPVFGETFYAIHGQGCFFIYNSKSTRLQSAPSIIFQEKKIIHSSKPHIKLILSRSHNDGFILSDYISENIFSIQTIAMGSSLKFCRIAQGTVDINIRTRPTSEWDTAAAQIILEESGRNLIQLDSCSPLLYNKEMILNPSFVAY